jgi:tRNA A-37 threonylcarbamoyl transferase component Bud32
VSPQQIERALKDLPSIGTRVKVRPYREVWRFEVDRKPYYLKFYPRCEGKLKRLARGSSALREFVNLQAMQRAQVPSPRAVAHLSGFTIGQAKGDAVILEGIEPSVQLDHYLNDLTLRGERAADHRALVRQVIEIVQKLGQARLGHRDLHLGNFLLKEGRLFLLDGYALRRGGMKQSDLMLLGHSVARFATTSDIVRIWMTLTGGPPPTHNPVRRRLWRKLVDYATGNNAYFGRLEAGEWSGWFFRHSKFPRRWAPASQVDVSVDDWQREWPALLGASERDELKVLKRSRSGDVLAGRVTLGGRTIDVIVKHPRRRKWWRYVNEIGRGDRAFRAWRKSWSLVARDIPTAWPLLLMQRRVMGYTRDAMIVFERVNGTLLSDLRLDEIEDRNRRMLFRRLGRTLRSLENQGLMQYDAKMSNWMIQGDEKLGPAPVMIDVDGVHDIWWRPRMWSIERLLRSMRDHPQYTPEDSKELCLGYAPRAKLVREDPAGSTPASPSSGGTELGDSGFVLTRKP